MSVPAAVRLPRSLLAAIERAAESAYPAECCGLLVGRPARPPAETTIEVTRIAPSANLAADPERGFEVAPDLFARLATGDEDGAGGLVGLYHSHPGGAPAPSARDRAAAWQGGWVWLVTAVADGRASATAAHLVAAGGGSFRALALEVVRE